MQNQLHEAKIAAAIASARVLDFFNFFSLRIGKIEQSTLKIHNYGISNK